MNLGLPKLPHFKWLFLLALPLLLLFLLIPRLAQGSQDPVNPPCQVSWQDSGSSTIYLQPGTSTTVLIQNAVISNRYVVRVDRQGGGNMFVTVLTANENPEKQVVPVPTAEGTYYASAYHNLPDGSGDYDCQSSPLTLVSATAPPPTPPPTPVPTPPPSATPPALGTGDCPFAIIDPSSPPPYQPDRPITVRLRDLDFTGTYRNYTITLQKKVGTSYEALDSINFIATSPTHDHTFPFSFFNGGQYRILVSRDGIGLCSPIAGIEFEVVGAAQCSMEFAISDQKDGTDAPGTVWVRMTGTNSTDLYRVNVTKDGLQYDYVDGSDSNTDGIIDFFFPSQALRNKNIHTFPEGNYSFTGLNFSHLSSQCNNSPLSLQLTNAALPNCSLSAARSSGGVPDTSTTITVSASGTRVDIIAKLSGMRTGHTYTITVSGSGNYNTEITGQTGSTHTQTIPFGTSGAVSGSEPSNLYDLTAQPGTYRLIARDITDNIDCTPGAYTIVFEIAASTPAPTIPSEVKTGLGTIPTEPAKFVQAVVAWGGSIVGGLAFIMMLYGGFLILTSQGHPENLALGREIFTGAVVGLLFVLFAVFILQFIGVGIGIPGFG